MLKRLSSYGWALPLPLVQLRGRCGVFTEVRETLDTGLLEGPFWLDQKPCSVVDWCRKIEWIQNDALSVNEKVGFFPKPSGWLNYLNCRCYGMLGLQVYNVRWMTWNRYWNTQLRLANYSSSLLVAYLRRSDGSFQPYNIEANSKFRLRTRNAEAFGSLCLVKMPFLFPPTRVMAEIK